MSARGVGWMRGCAWFLAQIERVTDGRRSTKYEGHRAYLRACGADPNERRLFHGAPPDSVPKILKQAPAPPRPAAHAAERAPPAGARPRRTSRPYQHTSVGCPTTTAAAPAFRSM